jgi:hypothetical protein
MEFRMDQSGLYTNSSLSFKFEFKSSIRRRDMASKLANNTGKKIKWFKGVEENFRPNSEIFKLSNKYSHASKTFIFETGALPYHDAMRLMLQTMNVIDHFGQTDDRCEMKVGISLNEKKLNLPIGVSKLNKFKYLIGLNEKEILKNWNTEETERKKISQSEYFYFHSKNPYYSYISNSIVERADPSQFNFPESDFFGHHFNRINEGILEISYIGGKDYQKKKAEAKSTINIIIDRLYNTLSENFEYTTEEKSKLTDLINQYKRAVESTKSPLNLKSNYPNIRIYHDLRSQEFLVESVYPTLREKIFDLIVFGGVHIADVNWDNDRKKLQVKGAKIDKNIVIEGIEFYDCIIEADAKNCLFSNCQIKNSKIENCDIVSSNFIKNSKVIECKYHGTNNTISRSYIDNNPNDMVLADVRECLVNRANFKLGANIDDKTTIINKT